MTNLKWFAAMLVVTVVNLGCLYLLLEVPLARHQRVSTVTIAGDPFISSLKKYMEQKGIESTKRVLIQLSALDQKVFITFSAAKHHGKPIAFLSQTEKAKTNSGPLRKEPTSDSRTAIKSKIQCNDGSIRKACKPSPQPTLKPEAIGRVKREVTTDSKTTFKPIIINPSVIRLIRREILPPQAVVVIDKEASTTVPEASPEGVSTQSSRVVRGAVTPSPQTVTTSNGEVVKKAMTPETTTAGIDSTTMSGLSDKQNISSVPTTAQATVVEAVTTPTSQGTTIKTTVSEARVNPKTAVKAIERVARDAVTPTKQDLIQEVTTPRIGEIQELWTTDLNLANKQETTIPPRAVREVPTPTSLSQKATRPNSRVFREIATEKPMNDKEKSIPLTHKKPFLKQKRFMGGIFGGTLLEELKQEKLHGVKRMSDTDDYPTDPPPTDPEGTDF